jgi:hypothetical protein
VLPSQRVFPSKESTTVVASVVPLLHVHTLVVPLQIRLPHELLVAVLQRTWERILPTSVVSLHVRLKVVAAAEELPASLNMALEVRIFLGGESPRLSSADNGARDAPLLVRSGGWRLLLTLGSPIVEWNW